MQWRNGVNGEFGVCGVMVVVVNRNLRGHKAPSVVGIPLGGLVLEHQISPIRVYTEICWLHRFSLCFSVYLLSLCGKDLCVRKIIPKRLVFFFLLIMQTTWRALKVAATVYLSKIS